MRLTFWETGLLSWLKGLFAVLDHLSSSRAGKRYRYTEEVKFGRM
jgi:hypothetical protein